MFAQARVEQAQEEWLQMQQSLQQQAGVHQAPPGILPTSVQPNTSSLAESQGTMKNSIATSVIREPICKSNQAHFSFNDAASTSQT